MTVSSARIALSNPKSPINVGSVLRAAGCFGVDEVWYTGNRFDKARKFHTDTHSATNKVPLIKKDSIAAPKADDTALICVDLVVGATPLNEFVHPENAIYWFGPEDGSLTQQQISSADAVIYIPTIGCLNLAATVNIVLYDRASKLNAIEASDAHIVRNRDRNNQTQVK